jgi:mRNA interferase HigB
MKVHLIKKPIIEQYVSKHASSKAAFEKWITAICHADWDKPEDIRQTFGSADLLGNGCERVVFNVGGNNYRLIAKYYFGEKRVHLYVLWIGTHAEYDELCIKGNQFNVCDF